MEFGIIGAGFSGAVTARHLAERGHNITILDERSHCGGNCHTSRDEHTGIMLHQYGPHIFHTAHKHIWHYVQRFAHFRPYINRVKATTNGRVYSLPINLHTINQFFNATFTPQEAQDFIRTKSAHGPTQPNNFEEQALHMIGPELYHAFFYHYTKKQWGLSPRELPASILKRLPLRFNYDDNYFSHPYQGIPVEGYTQLIQNILNHPRITLYLNTSFEEIQPQAQWDHIIYTGPIDRFFNFQHGRLGYRTLDFERIDAKGDYQGVAVMNYCDASVAYTRITEHKHFAPWEADQFKNSVCFKEYSRQATAHDTPYYPIRLTTEMSLLTRYIEQAKTTSGVSFLGRLGTYRYLDMDTTIAEALTACHLIDQYIAERKPLPAFFRPP